MNPKCKKSEKKTTILKIKILYCDPTRRDQIDSHWELKWRILQILYYYFDYYCVCGYQENIICQCN